MLNIREIEKYYPAHLHSFKRFMLREYLQYKILEIIFDGPYADRLIFLGGTCLRIVHGNQRFSEDLDFDNLSRGERNRLILSLSWAFRDVWENLYTSINLLFIDELVDSGMDASGVESSIAVLKRMTRERDKNVFLISHRDDLTSRVNHVLKVIKENGFTSYSNDIEIVA